MEWTHEAPTKRGWYWANDGIEVEIAKVDKDGVWLFGSGFPIDPKYADYDWYGPIKMPEVK